MTLIAALPMYAWDEEADAVARLWTVLRDALLARGVVAPADLVRCNADMPPVPGGIRDARGHVIAPDPASLRPDALDLPTLWRHPALLLSQTCWGPLEHGLRAHVDVLVQPSYDDAPGGAGPHYRSAIVARASSALGGQGGVAPPAPEAGAVLPASLRAGHVLAFNARDSRSGYLALAEDLVGDGGVDAFAGMVETGSHRRSILAVASGAADVAAIDGRSWALALRHEPAARSLVVVGWTAPRLGLPFICARGLHADVRDSVTQALRVVDVARARPSA